MDKAQNQSTETYFLVQWVGCQVAGWLDSNDNITKSVN